MTPIVFLKKYTVAYERARVAEDFPDQEQRSWECMLAYLEAYQTESARLLRKPDVDLLREASISSVFSGQWQIASMLYSADLGNAKSTPGMLDYFIRGALLLGRAVIEPDLDYRFIIEDYLQK